MKILYNLFIRLYFSFKMGGEKSNDKAFFSSICGLTVLFNFIMLDLYGIIVLLFFENDPLDWNPSSKLERNIVGGIFCFVGFNVFKWLIINKCGFSIEEGASTKYSFVPTKKQTWLPLVLGFIFIAVMVVIVRFKFQRITFFCKHNLIQNYVYQT